MSDQHDEEPDDRIEAIVRSILASQGLDALVREADEVSGEGELTDTPRPRTSLERAQALLVAAAAHYRDRATIAEVTQDLFDELRIERAVFVDPEGREPTEISHALDSEADRETASALEAIIGDHFR